MAKRTTASKISTRSTKTTGVKSTSLKETNVRSIPVLLPKSVNQITTSRKVSTKVVRVKSVTGVRKDKTNQRTDDTVNRKNQKLVNQPQTDPTVGGITHSIPPNNKGAIGYGEINTVLPLLSFIENYHLLTVPTIFLDIGCGTGKVVQEANNWLIGKGGRAIGVEIIKERIDEAKKNFGINFPVYHYRLEETPDNLIESVSHAYMYDLCFKRSYRRLRKEDRSKDPHANIQKKVFESMPNLKVFITNFEPELLVYGTVPRGWRLVGHTNVGPHAAKFYIYSRI